MGGLTDKPKIVQTPEVKDPDPLPQPDILGIEEEEARKVRRRRGRGRRQTFLTGDLTPVTEKKQLFG